ncbi:MAG TPA: NifB/NifX family molybdenum-iron cluster-binding protein [Vicinamibacteria bacterium]|nr:NifB/NifX family molybdenum-iron cluster-binding protein [Vicinamibacteria bacterium]
MKVALTTSGTEMSAPLDPRFGRAAYFIIYDLEDGSFQAVANQKSLNALQGAGVQAASTVARLGAGSLITGHCGPKAFRVLEAAGVRIYLTDARTPAEALARLRSGELQPAGGADVEGHWS